MPSRVPRPLDAAFEPLPDAALCVALSGGLDSTVLLHVLSRQCRAQSRPLRALHVHHGLSVHADAWVTACDALCSGLGIPLVVRRVDVDVDAGFGIEAAAREARRATFAEVLRPGEILVLAHHRDDQAETFLLRALRGSGPDGLGCMQTWQDFAHGQLWRPWLELPRHAIEAHAHAHGLRWIEDDSNADERFDRNYLRRNVMPLLQARWPHADEAFARAAVYAREAAALLRDEDMRALASLRTADDHVLSLAGLRPLPRVRRARVLRAWIASLDLPPLPRVGIQQIETDLLDARPDSAASFVWQGTVVQAWRDLLYAGCACEPLAATFNVAWRGEDVLELPGGGQLRLEGTARLDASVQVRARVGGERITLPGRIHSHALKNVLQDLGVPPWVRAHLPLLVDSDGMVLAAGDLVHSSTFDAWLRARSARLVWTAPGSE